MLTRLSVAWLLCVWPPVSVVSTWDASCEDASVLGLMTPGHCLASTSSSAISIADSLMQQSAHGRAAKRLGLDGAMKSANMSPGLSREGLSARLSHASEVLQQIQAFAALSRAGTALDPDAEASLQQMLVEIEETIIPALISSQQELEAELSVSHAVVVQCEQATEEYVRNISHALSTQEQSEQHHRTCRQQFGDMQLLQRNSSCSNLDIFVSEIHPCPANLTIASKTYARLTASGSSTKTSISEIIDTVDWVLQGHFSYWEHVAERYEEHASQCTQEGGGDPVDCDPLQITYEHFFCYRSYLEVLRAAHTNDCVRHLHAYEESAALAREKTQTAEVEYVSLRTIECYTHVILAHNFSTHAAQTQALDACGEFEADTSPVQITIQEISNVSVYGTAEEIKPGHADWHDHAYPGLPGVIDTGIVCAPSGPVATPAPSPPSGIALLEANPVLPVLFPRDVVANFSRNFDATTTGRLRSRWHAANAALDFIADGPGHGVVCHNFLLAKPVNAIVGGSFRITDMSNTSRDDGAALEEVEDARHAAAAEGFVLFGTPRLLVKNKGHTSGSGFDNTFNLLQTGASLPVPLPSTRTLRFCVSQPHAAHVRISDIQLDFNAKH